MNAGIRQENLWMLVSRYKILLTLPKVSKLIMTSVCKNDEFHMGVLFQWGYIISQKMEDQIFNCHIFHRQVKRCSFQSIYELFQAISREWWACSRCCSHRKEILNYSTLNLTTSQLCNSVSLDATSRLSLAIMIVSYYSHFITFMCFTVCSRQIFVYRTKFSTNTSVATGYATF
jgi:hypothetical protein